MKNFHLGLCILTLASVFTTTLTGQQAKLRKAQYYMEALQYDKAIRLYEGLYRKDPSSKQALNGLAKVYQKTGNLDEAAAWYAEVSTQADLPSDFFYFYGQIELQRGNCESAQALFNDFLLRKPYDHRRATLENVCAYLDEISNPDNQYITVEHPNINSEGSDLAPAFFNDQLVFGSIRQVVGEKHLSYDLYSAKPHIDDEAVNQQIDFGKVLPFSNDLNSGLNEAIITFSPDYTEAYFTRNSDLKATDERFPLRRLEILVALQNGNGQWSLPRPLSINSPNYSTAHPALSPDGNRLFFTSDRSGGFGGKDIYVCERQGQGWGIPVNLGPGINTAGDELYPFYHADGALYFASDGHIGLGGQDIFKAKELEDKSWGVVENLGAPINSIEDDFGLILHQNGTYGFFTSNRKGGAGGDDIYAFRPKRIVLNLNLVSEMGEPISNMVALMERGDEHPILTDENGHLSLFLMPDECKYINVADEKFYPFAAEICASDATENGKLDINWTIKRKEYSNDINYALSKGQSVLQGIVYDQLSGKIIPNAHIELQSDDADYTFELTSDAEGRFLYTWEKDYCFSMMVSKDGYFSKPYDSLICIKEKGGLKDVKVYLAPYRVSNNSNLIAATDGNLNGFAIGSSVYNDSGSSVSYRLNIYYDSGRASVRSEGIKELNRLKELMKNNPSLLVEICSHTDAIGPAAANWRLSQRRADAIVRYLVKRGIAGNRLIARGYGEERLVNDCVDGVKCPEEAHQLNRRTEFRVVDERFGQSD